MAEERILQMAKLFPVVCVLGARQVGKSTLLGHLLGSSVKSFVFDPLDDIHNARNDPEFFLNENPPPLLLDEIQFAPELLPAIKRRVDQQPAARGQYFLTGSQNLAVLRDVAESLAGRVGLLELPAMTLAEWTGDWPQSSCGSWIDLWMNGVFDAQLGQRVSQSSVPLSTRIWTGLMPRTIEANSPQDVTDILRSYLMTYLERDVRRVGHIDDLETFRRFLGVLGALTAQEINRSQLGREVGVSPLTAQKWLATLATTYQWVTIPAYHGNAVKRLVRHPKGYLHDTGLACLLQRLSSPDAVQVSPLLGALFETYAAMGIIKLAARMPTPPAVYHWRTGAGAELDLLLERDGRLWPFEFKAGTRIGRHDASGIMAFRATYPQHAAVPAAIVAPVPEPYRLTPDIWVLPYDLV